MMKIPFDSSYFDFDENTIKITQYEVMGELPDPFLRKDGRRVSSSAEWAERRMEIAGDAVDLQYGTLPPKPEVFRVEPIYVDSAKMANYRIIAGTKEKQLSFFLRVILPSKPPKDYKMPVVVDGDLCFGYAFNREFLEPMLQNNIAYALFNRTELADDVQYVGRRHGPLYDIYPEYTFGAIGAWAWGYSRVTDALEQIAESLSLDLNCVVFTGHSRGGKTALLAGAVDTRCAIVNPNETNAGGGSCYRTHCSAITEQGEERRSETLSDLWKRFDFWLGDGMGTYAEREKDLPFDCHFLKAMVAPRVLLQGEAADDIWTNPVGFWQTAKAAEEVFDFLGVKQNYLWYFRRGTHYHHVEDIKMLVEVIRHFHDGESLDGRYYATPFKTPDLIYSWKKP